MTQTPQQPPAGWYPDPAGGNGERFWDGAAWSQATRDPKLHWESPEPGPSSPASAAGREARPQQQVGPYGTPTQPRPDPSLQAFTRRQPQGPYATTGQAYAAHGKEVPVQGGRRLAGFWWRAFGYIIDSIIVGFLSYVLTANFQTRISNRLAEYLFLLADSMADPTIPVPDFPAGLVGDYLIIGLITIVLVGAYRSITLGLLNATLGQKVLGLRVAKLGDERLAPIGWTAAITRGVLGAFLYQAIGIFAQISVLFTDRKQTIPDLVSKTVVVNTREAI